MPFAVRVRNGVEALAMSTTQNPSQISSPQSRRTAQPGKKSVAGRRRGAQVLTLIAATSGIIAVAFINVLSTRFSYRTDVTSTSDQSLSPRTLRILGRITAPARIIIATDLTKADARVRTRLVDTLRDMERTNSNVTSRIIDVSREDGRLQFRATIAELAERESRTLSDQKAAIELATGGATSMASYLGDQLSGSILQIRDAIAPSGATSERFRQALDQAAALARNTARDLQEASTRTDEFLDQKIDEVPLPATDKARDVLTQGIDSAVSQMSRLAGVLRELANNADAAGPAGDSARTLIPELERRRDQSAVILESLRTLRRPDVLRVAEALRNGSAALVLGPQPGDASSSGQPGAPRGASLTAVDVAALLPDSAWIDQARADQPNQNQGSMHSLARADLARRSEELLSTALGALVTPTRPVVIFVHTEAEPLIDRVPIVESARERLSLRGIDVLEWSNAGKSPMPSLASVDPDRNRLLVFAVIPPDSSAAAPGPNAESGLKRAQALAATVSGLMDDGRNILLSLNPSVSPSYGDKDPFAATLERFGLAADTGRPLVTPSQVQPGVIDSDCIIQAGSLAEVPHPIVGAIKGLPVYLPWPIAMSERPSPEGVRTSATVLLDISKERRSWAESQWLGYWQTPRNQRAQGANMPKFDSTSDEREPGSSWSANAAASGAAANVQSYGWVVAVAAERYRVGFASQRLVVVGSNGWFTDFIATRESSLDGRRVPANPGNIELFESASAWLAGQDDLIAQSPTARAVPIIKPMSEKDVRNLRFLAILGLPGIVLLLGIAYRLIRG